MPIVQRSETVPLRSSEDIVRARQRVRAWATDLGFGLVDQTKLVTAASELARNAVDYGGGGEMLMEALDDSTKRALRLSFVDRGPGIADLELALTDGYSTGTGLGMGLGGARRLSNEFELASEPGRGTRVVIARWT